MFGRVLSSQFDSLRLTHNLHLLVATREAAPQSDKVWRFCLIFAAGSTPNVSVLSDQKRSVVELRKMSYAVGNSPVGAHKSLVKEFLKAPSEVPVWSEADEPIKNSSEVTCVLFVCGWSWML